MVKNRQTTVIDNYLIKINKSINHKDKVELIKKLIDDIIKFKLTNSDNSKKVKNLINKDIYIDLGDDYIKKLKSIGITLQNIKSQLSIEESERILKNIQNERKLKHVEQHSRSINTDNDLKVSYTNTETQTEIKQKESETQTDLPEDSRPDVLTSIVNPHSQTTPRLSTINTIIILIVLAVVTTVYFLTAAYIVSVIIAAILYIKAVPKNRRISKKNLIINSLSGPIYIVYRMIR